MIYSISNLNFSYNKNKKVLDNISFNITEGELVTILGRNGAGKSTLFSCMLGLNKPNSGEIILDNMKISEMKEKHIASIVGYVAQNNYSTFDYTVFEYVLMGCCYKLGLFSSPGKQEEEMAYNAIKNMNLLDLANRPISELSGGERQQVAIARAISTNPKIILFDEPTAHLDYTNQIKVLRLIKTLSNNGYAIAVTTHDPNHAVLLEGNVVLFDDNGHIEKGTYEDMLTEDKLSKVYGSDLQIRYLDDLKRNVFVYPSL